MKNFDITEKKLLHDYHAAFYKLFHVPLDWVGPNMRTFTICGKEHCNPLCLRIMASQQGARLCAELGKQSFETAKNTRKPVIHQCHAGFYDVTIPIFSGDQYVGSLCIGQYRGKRVNRKELEKVREQLHFLNISSGELEEYYRQAHRFSREEMEGLISLVQMIGEYLCDSYGRIQFMESVNRTDPVRAAELYIQKHYTKKLTIASIARSIGLSKSYFQHKFTDQTGMSPIHYLNKYRVERAAELLKNTDLTVGEIAMICGFGSVTMLFRHFSKIKSMTPKEFRDAVGRHTNSGQPGKLV